MASGPGATRTLEGLGVGSAAADSFVGGLPVHHADERRRLARIAAAAAGASATHAGGISVVLMDASTR